MSRRPSASRTRRLLHTVLASALAVTGLVAVPQAASAAGPAVVSGTVRVDANNDGQVTASAQPGRNDLPLAGVPMSLVCATDGTTLASTATSATGAYEFGTTDAGSCAQVKVRMSVAGFKADQYATQAASSANGIPMLPGNPAAAETASFQPDAGAPATLNGLVHPAWRSTLTLAQDPQGLGGVGVRTGSEPWDGLDGTAADAKVRTGDLVSYAWLQTFNQSDPRGPQAANSVFEQILDVSPTAVVNFSTVPATCSGTNPSSGILALPSNTAVQPGVAPPAGTTRLVLTCNQGPIGQGTAARSFSTSVWISNTSQNGASYTTTARMYGVDASGVPTVQPTPDVTNGPIAIVAEPRYDISKVAFRRDGVTRVINGVSTPGYDVKFNVMISQDRRKGVEAASQPLTFTEHFWGQYAAAVNGHPNNSTIDGLKWYMVACSPSLMTHGGGQSPGGRIGSNNGTAVNSVPDSGTCSYSRQPGGDSAPYTMTITGADLSGRSFPTRMGNGPAVPANTYYLTSHEIDVFVPLSEIARAGGSARFQNLVGGFDPKGASGGTNYGTENPTGEPGYCDSVTPSSATGVPALPCRLMPTTGGRSNNVSDQILVSLSGAGNSKGNVANDIGWSGAQGLLPNSGGFHDGAATVQPGQAFGSRLNFNANDFTQTNLGICDVIDVTTTRFVSVQRIARTTPQPLPNAPAYVVKSGGSPDVGTSNPTNTAAQIALQQNFRIEYAHIDITGDNANTGTMDPNDGRFQGVWTGQAAANCRDDSPSDKTWHATPEQVPGGLDAANAVRAVAVNGYVLEPKHSISMWVAQEMRETFNGGPRAGQTIPSGTLAVDYARYSSDESYPNWGSGRVYVPQPHAVNQDGDRVALTRALMAIQKNTVVAKNTDGDDVGAVAAAVGETKSTVAGRQVVWKLASTVTAPSLTDPAPVHNAKITDTLPNFVTYNAACTASLVGGTPPSTVTPGPNGTTVLVWNLGTLVPNEPIADRLVCTDTDPLAPNRTSVLNTARITADEVAYNRNAQESSHTVILEQDGRVQLRKDVDDVLDLQNDTQSYTLQMRNFSETQAIAAPTVIDVLSYNGDATNDAGLNRAPASRMSGTTVLQAAPKAFDASGTAPFDGTFYYTTRPGAQVPQHVDNDTDPTIWTTTFTPDATAFKFVAAGPMGTTATGNRAAIVIKYSTKQQGNASGDLYANRYTFFSDTLVDAGKHQLLTSNQTTVRVVGFSVGDFIWIDEDGDGKYTSGTDTPAPEGVRVEVRDADGAKVGETSTDERGRWVLNDLPAGEYYAVIPASEFAGGGLLATTSAAPNPVADPNTAKNEGVDHHAVAGAGGAVRTAGLLELSATRDATGKLVGNGPLDDNVANLKLAPLVTDDFSNLTLDMALQRVPGYTFTKTSNPASTTPVRPGEAITYTLTGTNTGGTPLQVTVSDDLAGVLEFADLAGTPTATVDGAPAIAPVVTGTGLAWSGTVQPGTAVVVTYTVQVKDGTEGETLRNEAVSSAKPPFGPELTPPAVQTEHPVPGYEFTKAASPASGTAVQPGDDVVYTLTGRNTGATPLDVTVADDLSDVLAYAELTDGPDASRGTATIDDDGLSWSGTLQPGQTVEITYTVKVRADTAGKTLRNAATSSATPPGDVPPITPPTVTTEHPVPGYAFDKAASPASTTAVQPGERITYTLTGVNTGATALQARVSDDLAMVLAYADLVGDPTSTVGDAPTVQDGALTWTGELAIGQTAQITYVVQVKAGTEGKTVRNSATSSATPPQGPDIVPPKVETEHPVPGYTFTKSSDPASGSAVQPGEPITYTLTGVNTGATALTVDVTDDLSGVLAHADLVGTPTSTLGDEPSVDGTALAWRGTLAVGETVRISYTVTVKDGTAGQTLRNLAASTATPPTGSELTPPPVRTEHPVPGYAFTKTADPASGTAVQPGDVITYTLTGVNTGATALDPVVVTDDLSGVLSAAALVDGSLQASVGGAAAAAPTLTGAKLAWTGSLAVGQSVVVTYQVRVADDAETVVLHNRASSTATPPNGPDLTPPAVETEHPTPGFSFTKTSDPASGTDVRAGDRITYTLTGNNFGETPLEPVVITDDLSGVLPFATLDAASVSAHVDGVDEAAAPVVADGTLTWTGSLQPGQTVTVVYTVTVDDVAPSADTVLRNHATASATPPGGTPVTPPAVETEHPIPGFALAKASDPKSGTEVQAGDRIRYTVTGTNTGATALTEVTVSDDLSAVLEHAKLDGPVAATLTRADGSTADAGAVTRDGSTLTWTGRLEVGEQVTLSYAVVAGASPKAVTLKNIAVAAWKPPYGPQTSTPPVSTEHPLAPEATVPPIAITGAAVSPLLGAAAGVLALAGVALLLAQRRRRHTA